MSEQKLEDLNDVLKTEVYARLGKAPKPKLADSSDAQDIYQNLNSILSSCKLLKSPLPRVSNFSRDPIMSGEMSCEQ